MAVKYLPRVVTW